MLVFKCMAVGYIAMFATGLILGTQDYFFPVGFTVGMLATIFLPMSPAERVDFLRGLRPWRIRRKLLLLVSAKRRLVRKLSTKPS